MRTEFKDSDGVIIAAIECDNSEFLMHVEQRILGTRVQAEELDVWIASADVYEDDGQHLVELDYDLHSETVKVVTEEREGAW